MTSDDWKLEGGMKMVELKLVSNRKSNLKLLVKAALDNELRLLEAGIRQTEQRLQKFEEKYQLNTEKFISRYENDEMKETLEATEWIGEFRMWKRLKEKIEALKDVQFAN
jgi:hypothetical protein